MSIKLSVLALCCLILRATASVSSNVCAGSNVQSSTCVINSCTTGFADCDADSSTGCEIDTTSDTNNCGACSTVCHASGTNVAGASCTSSVCGVQCSAGFGDCDSNAATGCETNIATDASNCGSCANSCASYNKIHVSTNKCVASACQVDTCIPLWGDCDNDWTNGCEKALKGDTSNCGVCGNSCPGYVNAAPACTNGVCSASCAYSYRDCNNDLATDGCETPVRQPTAYSEGLNGDKFKDMSPATAVYDMNSAVAYQGSLGLSFTPSSDPNNYVFFDCLYGFCISSTYSNGITFAVNGGSTGGQSIQITFIMVSYPHGHALFTRAASFDVAAAIGSAIPANAWATGSITIPAGNFGGFYIENSLGSAQSTVYFDNIQVTPLNC